MGRKTFEVSKMVDKINRLLYLPDDIAEPILVNQVARKAWISALEFVLFETGNYKAFEYQESDEVQNRTTVTDYDDTRRFYYGGTVDKRTLESWKSRRLARQG